MAELVYTDSLRKNIKDLPVEQQVHDINQKIAKNDKYKNIWQHIEKMKNFYQFLDLNRL